MMAVPVIMAMILAVIVTMSTTSIVAMATSMSAIAMGMRRAVAVFIPGRARQRARAAIAGCFSAAGTGAFACGQPCAGQACISFCGHLCV